ncbi:uncharacterized protein TNCV_3431811 [Trichonephila clavipes]|nr:uncharacterized protein TNCV_3431811 [Trichonephila clavipes]
MSWTYRWAVIVPRINIKGDHKLYAMASHTITPVVRTSLKTIWFHSATVQFPRPRHHSKQRRRWVGVKCSTRNRCRDRKCPSVKHLRMVREDIGAPSEGTAYTWMAADEAVGLYA